MAETDRDPRVDPRPGDVWNVNDEDWAPIRIGNGGSMTYIGPYGDEWTCWVKDWSAIIGKKAEIVRRAEKAEDERDLLERECGVSATEWRGRARLRSLQNEELLSRTLKAKRRAKEAEAERDDLRAEVERLHRCHHCDVELGDVWCADCARKYG